MNQEQTFELSKIKEIGNQLENTRECTEQKLVCKILNVKFEELSDMKQAKIAMIAKDQGRKIMNALSKEGASIKTLPSQLTHTVEAQGRTKGILPPGQ